MPARRTSPDVPCAGGPARPPSATRRRTLGLLLAIWVLRAAAHDAAHPHEPDPEEIALGSLADAELAFAARAQTAGRRAALLVHLDDDGVAIADGAQDRAALRRALRDAEPRFEASPAQIGVARAYDLGYVTGPCAFGAGGVRQHGVFLDVWHRPRPGAPWRIALSAITFTPGPVDFVPLGAAPRPAFTGGGSTRAARRMLLAIEAAATPDLPNARRYRAGAMPVLARDGGPAAAAPRAVPRAIRIARSCDLAVTDGTVRTGGAGPWHVRPYVHLWLRDGAGAWRLAFEVQPGRGMPRE